MIHILACLLVGQSTGDLIINNSIQQLDQSVREQNRILKEQEESRQIEEGLREWEDSLRPKKTTTETIVIQPQNSSNGNEEWFKLPERRPRSQPIIVTQDTDNTAIYVLAGAIVLAASILSATLLFLKPKRKLLVHHAGAPGEGTEALPQTREDAKADFGILAILLVTLTGIAIVVGGALIFR